MNHNFPKIYRVIVILSDFVTVICAFFAGIYFRNNILASDLPPIEPFDFPILLIYIVGTWWILLLVLDASERRRFWSLRKELRIGILATLLGIAAIFSIGFLTKEYFPRSMIISFCICFYCFWALQKLIGYQVSLKIREGRKIPILLVGAGNRAMEFVEDVFKHGTMGYKVVGFLDAREDSVGRKLPGDHHIIGSFSQLADILRNYLVEEVFFVLEPRHFGYLDSMMEVCSDAGINSHLIYTTTQSSPYKASSDFIGEIPCITFSRLPIGESGLFVKRMLDIIFSAVTLILLAPFFLIIAILIKLTSKGPVFFPWRVVGTGNRDFVGYKFRTMVENAEEIKEKLCNSNEMSGPVFKMKKDPRITPVGKWLRKFSLDELPQLWSVLKGDMSLVGPRPPFRHELSRYEFWQRRKISFKPGITCLWQVRGRNQICDFNDWCKLDLEYIDNWSLWLDLKILVQTAWVVIRGTGC